MATLPPSPQPEPLRGTLDGVRVAVEEGACHVSFGTEVQRPTLGGLEGAIDVDCDCG